jgi:hypothetical protein
VIEETDMSRNRLGQFEPGTSGNPRGRPRKLRRKMDQNQLREDFFEAGETLVTIVEKGKRKSIPINVAIERKLALLAASGEIRAIVEWQKMRRKHTAEYDNEQQACVEQLMKCEEFLRNHPEDVTDHFKTLIRMLRSVIDPDNLLLL